MSKSIYKRFVEEFYAMLYIFDSDYSWETFLECAKSGIPNMKKKPQLYIIACKKSQAEI